mmetsp:Transcript_33954/g.67606  ORF Transcript_33954/g.67606 Transcript_33954/m.67606 type:complete len:207 (-) Transcript_33954:637-1257(-)
MVVYLHKQALPHGGRSQPPRRALLVSLGPRLAPLAARGFVHVAPVHARRQHPTAPRAGAQRPAAPLPLGDSNAHGTCMPRRRVPVSRGARGLASPRDVSEGSSPRSGEHWKRLPGGARAVDDCRVAGGVAEPITSPAVASCQRDDGFEGEQGAACVTHGARGPRLHVACRAAPAATANNLSPLSTQRALEHMDDPGSVGHRLLSQL